MTRKPKLGRPAGPPEAVRSRHVRVPVSEAEGAELDAWAPRGQLAAKMREAALRSARKVGRSVGIDRKGTRVK